MTYCNKCKLPIGDFGSPMFEPHYCTDSNTRTLEYKPPKPRVGLKCDMCGSTAIDHTENQCSMNRQLRPSITRRKLQELRESLPSWFDIYYRRRDDGSG